MSLLNREAAVDSRVTLTYTCPCGAYMSASATSGMLATSLLTGQKINHHCPPREPVDVVAARQVVLVAIRRHPIALGYLSGAAIEAHAAGIVLALTQSGHLR